MIDSVSLYKMIKKNDFLLEDDQIREILNILNNENIKVTYIKGKAVYHKHDYTYHLSSVSFKEPTGQYYVNNYQHEKVIDNLEKENVVELIVSNINRIEMDLEREIFYLHFIQKEKACYIMTKLDISQYSYYKSLRFAMMQYLDMFKKQ